MFWTIIFIVAISYAAYHLIYKFGDRESVIANVIKAVAIGIIAAILKNYLIPLFPEFSWIYLIVILGFIAGITYQFYKEGDELNEFVATAFLIGIVGLIGCGAAANYGSLLPLLMAIIVPILAIGFCAISALMFNRGKTDDAKVKTNMNRLMALATVLTLIALIGGSKFALSMANNGFLGNQEDPTSTEMVQASDTDTEVKSKKEDVKSSVANWHFYNNDVQGGSEEDDFNFGPKPKVDTAAEYDEDFRERLEEDPALGAADIAWADAWLGTRYLGEFYESCNKDWAKTINAAKEAWIKDPDAYEQTLDAFFQFLNTAEVKVTAGNGLEDQMYMNPYTVDGTPDVIVLATPDHTGKFLTYLFTIKGTGKIKVMYRIDCGYQPTNVEEIMGITPQEKPSSPSSSSKASNTSKSSNPSNPGSSPSKPKGGKGSNPSNPSNPSSPSNPKYNKDPNKAPKKNTEPNDDPGPGPNTNNPSDPNHSSKDTPDSSSSMTYDEYKENVENLKDTNENQKTGDDNNKPSTPAPKPSTNVDNNGDSGNGGAPINKPTPKQEAETVKDDPAAGQMSEPS